ncbi:MAG: LysM peptidoglycan-binding domain-containing protein [Desulfobacteraceae bacterium]
MSAGQYPESAAGITRLSYKKTGMAGPFQIKEANTMMKQKKFSAIFITVLFLLCSGCQHSMVSQTKSGNNPRVTASKHVTEKAAEANAPPTVEGQTKNRPASEHAGTDSVVTAAPPTQGGMADNAGQTKVRLTPQTGIDNALAMCQSAQLFWEKGELENALAELDMAYKAILDIDTDAYPGFNQQKEDIRYMISKRILEIYASRNIVVNGEHDAIPITINKYVKAEIEHFTKREKRFFTQSMERAQRYRPFIVSEFKKAGLPTELAWLPLVESGFKIRALSPARALGLWQFIPSTGYKFGLERNYYIDERLDPVKSTRAAIAYLKALHKIFGDWATVLAAYNCGEGRVLRIIRKQNINYLDNFWDLYEKLPRETAQYVPRFLATLHIIKNLDKYNITVSNPLEPIAYKSFSIDKQIRLADLAKEIKTSKALLKELNPELRYALLPPQEYTIRIPADKAEIFTATLDKIKSSYPAPKRYAYHRVRRGDTLSVIAERYNSSVRAISSANKIFRKNRIVAGKVLKIPSSGAGANVTPGSSSSGRNIKYTVKRGDNLWIIARRHNTTTNKIMAANNLSSSALHIGQKLVVNASKTSSHTQKSTYWVKSGDNPFTIAKKYNMSLHRLLSLNNLTKRSKIYPGQKLLVE